MPSERVIGAINQSLLDAPTSGRQMSESSKSHFQIGTNVESVQEKRSQGTLADMSDKEGKIKVPRPNKNPITRRLAKTAATMGLTAILMTSSNASGNSESVHPSNELPQNPAPSLIVDNLNKNFAALEILQKQIDIEQKYDLRLISQEEAYESLGLRFDTTIKPLSPSGWTDEQLTVIDKTLSLLPPKLTEPIEAIFNGNLVDICQQCAGVEYKYKRIIGLRSDDLKIINQKGIESLLTHEATHAYDYSVDKSLEQEVKDILGNQSYLKLEEFSAENLKLLGPFGLLELVKIIREYKINPEGETNIPEVITLEPDKQSAIIIIASTPVERVAAISQMYIKGEKILLTSMGPLIDGEGYNPEQTKSDQVSTLKTLRDKYPTTESLYEYWKTSVFGGKEYDSDLKLQ